jgi:hypothetical protein
VKTKCNLAESSREACGLKRAVLPMMMMMMMMMMNVEDTVPTLWLGVSVQLLVPSADHLPLQLPFTGSREISFMDTQTSEINPFTSLDIQRPPMSIRKMIHRTGLSSDNALWLVFGGCWVQNSIRTPVILIEVFYGLPHFIRANSGIVPSKTFSSSLINHPTIRCYMSLDNERVVKYPTKKIFVPTYQCIPGPSIKQVLPH